MVFRPRLVLLHVLDLSDLTTNSSRDREFVTDIFIGHRNISKPIKSDMLTSDDRKEVDFHLQRGSIARGIFRDILELVFF